MSKNYIPCQECGELEDHKLHHDVANPVTESDVHFDECNTLAYQGDPPVAVILAKCHEFEAGCYCADAGKCEVCVDQAVDYADHLRDAAKEA
jgi:hypothetical protein